MKNKKIFVGILLGVLFISSISSVMAEEQVIKAGITPDSILWRLDVALDRVVYFISSIHSQIRNKIGIKILKERIAEIKEMEERGLEQAKEKALREYRKFREKVIEPGLTPPDPF